MNEQVPRGADGDAARLSRPRSTYEPTVANHDSPLRRSLLTGECVADALPARADGPRPGPAATERARTSSLAGLITIEDPVRAHRAWLDAWLPATVAESMYHPYTSLKYHTLLTAALLDNYRAGHDFADLALVVDPPVRQPTRTDPIADRNADAGAPPDGDQRDDADATATATTTTAATIRAPEAVIVPHRTVFTSRIGSLRLTATPGDRPATPLGANPERNLGEVWARLPAQPAGLAAATGTTTPGMSAGTDRDTTTGGDEGTAPTGIATPTATTTTTPTASDGDPILDRRAGMLLDAQLRRLRSWSTALQYLADYVTWRLGTTRTQGGSQ